MTYLVRMRSKFRPTAVAVVLVAALAATGCAPEPAAPHTPAPTSTPLFASDEEALTAAEEAYAAYQRVSDEILSEGGQDPERLLEVATEAQYEYEKSGFDEAKSQGLRSIGASRFDTMTIQDRKEEFGDGTLVLSVRFCEDVGGVDIVNAAGVSVVDMGRPARFPRVAYFDASQPPKRRLLVSTVEEWEGTDYCAGK